MLLLAQRVTLSLRTCLVVLALSDVSSKRLPAQAFPVTDWAPRIMPRILYNTIRDSLAASRPIATITDAPPDGAAVSPSFEPSIDRRRINIARRIAQIRTVDPEAADELSRVTAQGDTIAAFAARVRASRINAYSVTDAFACWVTIIWEELHPDVPRSGALLVTRTQAARALQDTPAFATATDAEKQELAEALILNIVLNAARLRDARGNATQQAAVFSLIQRAGSELRVDFAHMTATAQGFMPSDMVKPGKAP